MLRFCDECGTIFIEFPLTEEEVSTLEDFFSEFGYKFQKLGEEPSATEIGEGFKETGGTEAIQELKEPQEAVKMEEERSEEEAKKPEVAPDEGTPPAEDAAAIEEATKAPAEKATRELPAEGKETESTLPAKKEEDESTT